jgi:hypothetical protein
MDGVLAIPMGAATHMRERFGHGLPAVRCDRVGRIGEAPGRLEHLGMLKGHDGHGRLSRPVQGSGRGGPIPSPLGWAEGWPHLRR